MNRFLTRVVIASIACIVAACSFVSLDSDAKSVNVTTNAQSLANCKFVGKTIVSVWSKASTFQSQETVESQLDTLARNQAPKMGGNTVTPDSPVESAARTYRVYNCK